MVVDVATFDLDPASTDPKAFVALLLGNATVRTKEALTGLQIAQAAARILANVLEEAEANDGRLSVDQRAAIVDAAEAAQLFEIDALVEAAAARHADAVAVERAVREKYA